VFVESEIFNADMMLDSIQPHVTIEIHGNLQMYKKSQIWTLEKIFWNILIKAEAESILDLSGMVKTKEIFSNIKFNTHRTEKHLRLNV
jgi:hypothetical protein